MRHVPGLADYTRDFAAVFAFVLGVETPGLVAAAVGALASASKYVLRSRRGHIFNPAGLALLAAWSEFVMLLGVLLVVILRGRPAN